MMKIQGLKATIRSYDKGSNCSDGDQNENSRGIRRLLQSHNKSPINIPQAKNLKAFPNSQEGWLEMNGPCRSRLISLASLIASGARRTFSSSSSWIQQDGLLPARFGGLGTCVSDYAVFFSLFTDMIKEIVLVDVER